jgi:hypothetical protein
MPVKEKERIDTQSQARVGLYFGDISHMSALWIPWVAVLASQAIDWKPFWDGSFANPKTLASLDIIIVPGGFCSNTEKDFGGRNGRENLRSAIRSGVHYIGTCYGASIAMSKGSQGQTRLGLVEGEAKTAKRYQACGTVRIDYSSASFEYLSWSQETAHINGPVFLARDCEVFGRFANSQPGPFAQKPENEISGMPAAIAKTVGRGKAVLFSSHPEIPATYSYDEVLEKVGLETMDMKKATEILKYPPSATSQNQKLLSIILSRMTSKRDLSGDPFLTDAQSQQMALLRSSIELLQLKIDEIRETTERLFRGGDYRPCLQIAQMLIYRRLQSTKYWLSRLSPDIIRLDPVILEQASLCMVLCKLYCLCDHSGIMNPFRYSTLYQEMERSSVARRTSKAPDPADLSTRIIRRIIMDLDNLISISKSIVQNQMRVIQ